MAGWHIDTIKYLGRGWRWAALSTCKLKSGYFYSFLSIFMGGSVSGGLRELSRSSKTTGPGTFF